MLIDLIGTRAGPMTKSQEKESDAIQLFSKRLTEVQAPIRIIESVRWTDQIRDQFLRGKGKIMPKIDQALTRIQPCMQKIDPDDVADISGKRNGFLYGNSGGLGSISRNSFVCVKPDTTTPHQ